MSELTILHFFIFLENVSELFDALTEGESQGQAIQKSSNLKALSLNVIDLSLPLFELVARKFPELEKLSLKAIRITGSDEVRVFTFVPHLTC